MTDTPDGPVYRSRHRATGDAMRVREPDDDSDDTFEVRLPVASLGEVRNEGDDPLTREELRGMAAQIRDRQIGVFPSHGDDGLVTGGRYSQFEKLGVWSDAEIDEREGADVLLATARMPDPNTLPDLGSYRQALGILKEQAKRGIPMDASIGWRDDPDFPGGVDLMEVSIVGIGADPRTTTGDEDAEVVARAAVEAGADREELVRRVRDAVETARPLGPPEDPERFEDFDACVAALSDDADTSREDAKAICGAWEQAKEDQAARVDDDRAEYEVGDETVEITPPEYMADAADLAMSKSDEGLGSDCGTGVGDSRADQIRNDQVGPEVVAEVAAYLTSHEEDVTADGPPSEWSDEEWDDCGNIQYAKWGGDGSGDALAWAQGRANAVADARGEELPYPNRGFQPAGGHGRNLDDPAFSEGDAVTWTWDGEPVHGRVAGIHEEFTPPEADEPITGDDGEAVYSIHEFDEEVEAFRRQNVAKPESSLDESGRDMPPATDENFQSMTDDDTGDDDPGTDDAQDAPDDGDNNQRAPDDLTEERLATFAAVHYDGMDESDLMDAADAADAEFLGTANVEELYDLVSVVVGAEYDAVESAMEDLAGGENEMGEDDEEEEDDEDDERTVAEKVDALERQFDKLRNGEIDLAGTDDSDDGDESGERDADADADSTDTETTDDGERDAPDIRVSDL